MKEEDIIKNLKNGFASLPEGVFGIGDDAALIPADPGERYLISKDHMAEGVHFRLSYFDPESLAHKALHTNMSDIAAMGGTPLFVLLGIAIPPTVDANWADRFSKAFTEECHKHNIILIGGDTTVSRQDMFISITIIGKARQEHIKFRHTAKAGDVLCVAGALGESHAGLVALERSRPGFEEVKLKCLRPTALKAEGVWLGGKSGVTAMMDISDGLYLDLKRMMESSHMGAHIHLETLPPSPSLQTACRMLNIDPVQCILTGGEDYALLFTVSSDTVDKLGNEFEQTFGYAFQKIGTITNNSGVTLMQNGMEVPFQHKVFSHFENG